MGNRRLKGQPLFLPDRSHIHHRLLDLGLGHTATVFVVYGATYLFCLIALFSRGTKEWVLLLIFLGSSATLYLGVKGLLHSGGLERLKVVLPAIDPSYMTLRRLVTLSDMTVTGIKYLLVLLFASSLGMPMSGLPLQTTAAAVILVATVLFACFSNHWSNALLQATLYAGSALLIFLMDHAGREAVLWGVPLHLAGTVVYGLLILLISTEILIRRRVGILTTTPFEYFILFIVVLMPLLPSEITAQYHLFAVTGKTVVVFVAYKLILMDNMAKNRKIILALTAGLCGYLIKLFKF